MKTTMVVDKQVGQAQLGTWLGPEVGVDVKASSLVPYGKSREDLEVILRSQELLAERQAIELSGFGLYTALPRAYVIEDELVDGGLDPYAVLASNHPVLVSYPFDVLWLVRDSGMNALRRGMTRVFSRRATGLGLSRQNAAELTERFIQLARASSRSYAFWRSITATEYEGETRSRFLMEWTIASALWARAKAMAGLVPVIDSHTPGSVALSHAFNLAYGNVMQDRDNEGRPAPAYLYTIGLNSTMIRPDTWTEELDRVVRNARVALEEMLFDGVHLAIRGLPYLSNSRGRVDVVLRLIDELSRVCQDIPLPLWWSRPGVIGVGGLDHGVNFASYQLNLSFADVYYDGGPVEDVPKYGKIYHPTRRELWNRDQVRYSLESPEGGMPDIGPVRQRPTQLELGSPQRYRIGFSKPYNMAVLNSLAENWWRNIDENETQPGQEYLQGADTPFNAWGLR